jgi:hypothetical protein
MFGAVTGVELEPMPLLLIKDVFETTKKDAKV